VAKGFKDYVSEANALVETLDVDAASALVGNADVQFIDVRDGNEVASSGTIPGAQHASRGMLEFKIDPACPMHDDTFASGKRFVFYCGTGGRSALAAKLAMDMGLEKVCHMAGGFTAWNKAGKDVTPPGS
jgi:rhodanese-related sulfurtransferase